MTSLRLGEIPLDAIEFALRGKGLAIWVGSFQCRIRSDTGLLSQPLRLLYPDYPASTVLSGFFDLDISLLRKRAGWKTSEVEFAWDGQSPFPALPLSQTHPLFEWGLNWCIATISGENAVVHSAVVEKDGKALVLPGQPGSGKSTLSAHLALSGWRLLSDELTIVSIADGCILPMPRPISLKGRSIDIIRNSFPNAVMTEPIADTRKGPIAYVRPLTTAVEAYRRTAPLGHLIFPRFSPGARFTSNEVSRAYALTRLLDNTFNVGLLGFEGFKALARTIACADCHEIEYGNISDVVAWIEAECR